MRRNPDANARLTAAAAVPLVVLLAIEGITLLALRPLLTVHELVGLMLAVPVALKLASTGWRFVRYYLRDEAYVAAGPPHTLLRMLAPVLAITTVGIIVSGVALLFLGTRGRTDGVLLLHKASFIVWVPVFAIHLLAYAWRVPRLLAATSWLQRFAPVAALALGALVAVGLFDMGHPSLSTWFDYDHDRF